MTTPATVPISFRADPSERASLRAEAQRRGVSQSDLIRGALERDGVKLAPTRNTSG